MRRSWAVGLLIISILAMACGGAADVDDYKAAFVYVGPADDGGWSQAHDVGTVSYTHLTLPTKA